MERREFLKLSSLASLGLLSSFTVPTNNTVPLRGIYLSGWKGVNKKNIDSNIAFMKRVNLNTILIDIKNANGSLFFKPKNKIATSQQVKTATGDTRQLNISYLVEQAKKNDMRLIARHVMFRDKGLYLAKPEWQLHKQKSEYWVDMRKQEVVDYNLSLLEEEKNMGFDEIALDYIRYPAVRAFDPEPVRCDVIDNVVRQAKEVVSNIDLGVQIFGYALWHNVKAGIGQRIETLSEHADVVYPMVYPSLFWKGSFGLSNPNNNPYKIISLSCQEGTRKTTPGTTIIPMLQAYNYSSQQLAAEIQATKDNNAPGYIFWNSGSEYKKLIEAYKQVN